MSDNILRATPEYLKSMRYPLLFKLLLFFVFFLPLRGVQIPIGVFGFEINPARIVSVFMALLIGMNICLDARYFRDIFRHGKYRNPYVFFIFVYFLFSILYYYVLVLLGETILFGTGETFFLRNWQGRPFAQILSFITYGLIPFYLVKRYAQNEKMKMAIERVFTIVMLFLLYFACVQVVSYIILRAPLIGRQLLESKYDLGAVTLFGIPLYRVNSLAGEPRDFGTFLLGAIPFYMYVRYGKMRLLTIVNVLLMICAFFLTTSNSAFVALSLFFLVILGDVLYRGRARFRPRYMKYALIVLLIIFFAFRTQLIEGIGKRTVAMYQAIVAQLQTEKIQPLVQEQTSNIVVLYYIVHMKDLPLTSILFGSGYSNFITPVADLYKRYFHRTVENTGIFTSDTFAAKLLVEGGVVGIGLYCIMFFYTLKMNMRLLHFFRMRRDKQQYHKALLLRLAFIAFFVAGAVQSSYYYFIPMGLIIGWLNGVLQEKNRELPNLYDSHR